MFDALRRALPLLPALSRTTVCLLISVSVSCAWLSFDALAQVGGRLRGTVSDSSGGAIVGADVELMRPGRVTAVLAVTTTDEGRFEITGIPAGIYDLLITATGFSEHLTAGINVDPARQQQLDAVVLSVEATTLRVEVVAPAQSVQITTSELSTTVTNEQVRRLPISQRYVMDLIGTQAGVSQGVIDGQRASSVNVTLDGINIQDNYIRDNAGSYTPNLLNLDQVAEFTLVTANADATLGGGSSQAILVTPSGTDALHGALYWYNRDDALAANSWFNNTDDIDRPPLSHNQVGGSLGGPVLTDTLYFYGNYEAFRRRLQPLVNRTILTEDARNGIFTYLDTGGVVQKVDILAAAGVTPDASMEQLLAMVPGPENINNFRTGDSSESLLRNTAGYSFLVKGHHDRDNATLRLDYTQSVNHYISGSFLWNRQDVTRSDLTNDYSVTPKVRNRDDRQFLSVGWRWSPTPFFTNELRGGFNLAPLTFTSAEEFGPHVFSGTVYSNPVNGFRSQGRDTGTYSLMDDAMHIGGWGVTHFGFHTQQVRVTTLVEDGVIPTYFLGLSFGTPGLDSSQLPGVSPGDLATANNLLVTLAGFVNGYNQTFNVVDRVSGFQDGEPARRHYSLDNHAFYGQQRVALTDRLTVSAGLRYELPSVVDERNSLVLMPVVESNDPVATLLGNATLDFAGSAVGRPFYGRDKNNLAPSVGLAWDVFGDGRTAFRSAYSVSYVNDESFRGILNYVDFNQGLVGVSAQGGLSALASNLPAIPVPAFQVPRTFQDNFLANPFTAFGLADPNLRTPYVQQWSAGVEREFRGMILEVRYVGNHATKLLRGFDVNPVRIRETGFSEDFERAARNAYLALDATGVFDPNYDASIAGSEPLTVFPNLAFGGLLNNPTVLGLLQTGEAGELAFLYHLNGLSGGVQFYQNPFSLASLLVNNHSNTSYNALQIDLRYRTLGGAQLQANYTYGRVLSDADGTAQHRFQEFRDPLDGAIDRARPSFDITHAIKLNGVYDLPVGPGRRFDDAPMGWLVDDWAVSGIMTWQSGSPLSILSQRGTLLRRFRSGNNTAASPLTKSELDEILRFRMTDDGPFVVASSAIGVDGRGVAPDGSPPFAGQAFFHPGAAQIGSLQQRWFSGPWTFNVDLAVMKTFTIRDTNQLELRAESTNVFNTPTWRVDDQIIGSPTFGRVFATAYGSREIQLSLHYRF